jgi:hypothetical protein
MHNLQSIFTSRTGGELRYSVVTEYTGSIARALGMLGLKTDETSLFEYEYGTALEILIAILWKDMAYESEFMPQAQAAELARQFLDEHSVPGSKYYSNGNWALRESWNPLTEATFDTGIIIVRPDHRIACFWVEDED